MIGGKAAGTIPAHREEVAGVGADPRFYGGGVFSAEMTGYGMARCRCRGAAVQPEEGDGLGEVHSAEGEALLRLGVDAPHPRAMRGDKQKGETVDNGQLA